MPIFRIISCFVSLNQSFLCIIYGKINGPLSLLRRMSSTHLYLHVYIYMFTFGWLIAPVTDNMISAVFSDPVFDPPTREGARAQFPNSG